MNFITFNDKIGKIDKNPKKSKIVLKNNELIQKNQKKPKQSAFLT